MGRRPVPGTRVEILRQRRRAHRGDERQCRKEEAPKTHGLQLRRQGVDPHLTARIQEFVPRAHEDRAPAKRLSPRRVGTASIVAEVDGLRAWVAVIEAYPDEVRV